MGTKRVGMARVRSLINENANQIGARRRHVMSAVTADKALESADLGKVILLNGTAASNFEITLPADPTVGSEITFVLVANSNAAAEILIDSGSGHTINGYAIVLGASSNATAYHSHRKLGFGDASKKGATLTLVCSSANHWMVMESKSDVTWINVFS